MQPSDVRRTLRRARHRLSFRNWPLQRKIAYAVWIPAVIFAVAQVTGPNRPATPAAATPPPGAVTTIPFPTPTTVSLGPSPAVGKWMMLKRARRIKTTWGEPDSILRRVQTHWRAEGLYELPEGQAPDGATPTTVAATGGAP